MTDPFIRSIPLDRLERSPANVRRTDAGKAAFAELKASIVAHGLLENLVARSIGPGEDGGEHYTVIAGARRLAVLNDLARDRVLDTDHPIPCRIIGNSAIDSELSLAENVVRVAMHPADQVQAFGALASDGASVADIAARFGVSERTVEQRLRLGNAAPEILDAYRADEIDLETLKAFAVTTDRERQMAVWEQVSEQDYRPSGWHDQAHAHPGPRASRVGHRHLRRPGRLTKRPAAPSTATSSPTRTNGASGSTTPILLEQARHRQDCRRDCRRPRHPLEMGRGADRGQLVRPCLLRTRSTRPPATPPTKRKLELRSPPPPRRRAQPTLTTTTWTEDLINESEADPKPPHGD